MTLMIQQATRQRLDSVLPLVATRGTVHLETRPSGRVRCVLRFRSPCHAAGRMRSRSLTLTLDDPLRDVEEVRILLRRHQKKRYLDLHWAPSALTIWRQVVAYTRLLGQKERRFIRRLVRGTGGDMRRLAWVVLRLDDLLAQRRARPISEGSQHRLPHAEIDPALIAFAEGEIVSSVCSNDALPCSGGRVG